MNFVQKVLDDREKHIINKRNLSIDIDKRIAELRTSSKAVSGNLIDKSSSIVSKGKSHKLLKKVLLKDKHTKQKIKENEQNEALELVSELKKEIQELKDELDDKQMELENKEKQSEILDKLFQKGLIDDEGNPTDQIKL